MGLYLNDEYREDHLPTGTPVLDYLRLRVGLTGTKEGCREGDCGACMVLVGQKTGEQVRYQAVTSCLLPLGELEGRHLVTVEGLNQEGLNPIQQAIVDEGASQCGFCTPGIVLSLTGFLLEARTFDPTEAVVAVEGNICRCTGYSAIRRAIERLCRQLNDRIEPSEDRVEALIREGVLPAYFLTVHDHMAETGAAFPERRPGQRLVAGGTDLYVQDHDKLCDDSPLLLTGAGLGDIRDDDGTICLGAAATVEDVRRSSLMQQLVPNLRHFTDLVSSQPIRRRATLGGNVVNASPIGDLTIMLLAWDAEVEIASASARRSVKLKDFFTGYKEFDLGDDELIEAFRFRPLQRPLLFNFEKVSKRTHLDIASVNSALCARVEGDRLTEVHVAAGGVAPVPLYLTKTSRFLSGKAMTAAVVLEAVSVADQEISPISDIRGTSDYKRLLLRQLIFAHFHELFGLGEELMEKVAR